ncbi:MAG TPA: HIT domain-containing protein [Terriglobia bacterium]|nr:HIT domain-containing protein [Terriglobia bacterium]
MEYLWSPWRFRYVSGADQPGHCVFCKLAGAEPAHDPENLILHRGRFNFIVLNLYPYTTGHALVVPYAHVAQIVELQAESMAEMMEMTQKLNAATEAAYHPDGYNLGMNIGKAAGAGVADHLHLHFLPRWFGSSNFITVIGEARVLPEDLKTTYDKLASFFRG